MTVASSANKVITPGNGVQTSFAFSFIGVAAADISVIYTDAAGVQTTLVNGPGATQYQLALNAASPGQLWGVGGTVTYNPSGTPIATGTTLTIVRTVPNTQGVSLQNQASFGQYAAAAETAIDLVTMAVQQLAEAQARVISAPVVDSSSISLVLPAAAQRANLALVFDGSGNVIAGQAPAAGTISSAMQPVVNAASLAAGRSALGLGAMALEGIGAGLQDDGAGLARVFRSIVADASNQAVTTAFHLNQRVATGALTYTIPRANTLFANFEFAVFALTAAVTFAIDSHDTIQGLSSGVSLVVPAGSVATVRTNALAAGTIYISVQRLAPQGLAPQRTVLAAGASGTYTTPSGATRLLVRVQAAGGGGCGNGPGAGNGTGGGNSTFGTLTAGGGAGGTIGSSGGTGGVATGGDINIPGGIGGGANTATSNNTVSFSAGSSFMGSGGPGSWNSPGQPGKGFGAGGAGAGGNSAASVRGESSGDGGGYVEKLILNPAATYAYSVGSKGLQGAAGAGGNHGGDATDGIIIVDAFFD